MLAAWIRIENRRIVRTAGREFVAKGASIIRVGHRDVFARPVHRHADLDRSISEQHFVGDYMRAHRRAQGANVRIGQA